jgi:acyl-CoA synthetase (AMP-forming)/AMP-acid ligase II
MRHDAMAVLREGARATPEELITLCRERGPLCFDPRHIAVMPAVPFNSTGKIDRAALQVRLRAA